jgi:hypothetical protein
MHMYVFFDVRTEYETISQLVFFACVLRVSQVSAKGFAMPSLLSMYLGRRIEVAFSSFTTLFAGEP